MMNLQTVPSEVRWQPSVKKPEVTLDGEERWSDFSEVLTVLRIAEHVHGQ